MEFMGTRVEWVLGPRAVTQAGKPIGLCRAREAGDALWLRKGTVSGSYGIRDGGHWRRSRPRKEDEVVTVGLLRELCLGSTEPCTWPVLDTGVRADEGIGVTRQMK